MKTLPNGVKVFNATPHPIAFWDEKWDEVVMVSSDAVLSAKVEERVSSTFTPSGGSIVTLVKTQFVPLGESAEHLIEEAYEMGADVIVGSIIAAKVYPGVVAMVPCEGYERVPPAEKRMRPDKFTVFGR